MAKDAWLALINVTAGGDGEVTAGLIAQKAVDRAVAAVLDPACEYPDEVRRAPAC